jgi:Putative sugar-binding domain/Amidohydrolase
MGEIGLQYEGLSPSDPSVDQYFALAEELDIPIAIHMGTGGTGRANIAMPKFRGSIGNPLLLEELLARHPKLRSPRSGSRSGLLSGNHSEAGDDHWHLVLEALAICHGGDAPSEYRSRWREGGADSGRGGQCEHTLSSYASGSTLGGLIGASPVLLQAPGVVGSAEAKAVLVQDPAVKEAARLFAKLDLALVGIGSLDPSPLLASSGNIFSEGERRQLRRSGAVGDICFQFIDEKGKLLKSPLMDRVIGVDLVTLKASPRVVGIAGGLSKVRAILASLRGKWINVLITDRQTAERLVHSEGMPIP